MNSPNRTEKLRSFLRRHSLQGWLTWRPDEILLLSGHFPFWGASFLLYLAESPSILFVPVLEPRDHIPQDLRVIEYPWGSSDCADPFAVLMDMIRKEQERLNFEFSRIGMNRNSSRTSHPIQAAEGLPVPDAVRDRFSAIAATPSSELDAAFADLYISKSLEEIQSICLANQVACAGIRAFQQSVKPGIPEVEISAIVEGTIQKQVGNPSVFYARGWAMVQSGPNSADAGCFNRSTDRRLQAGDLVLMELATCVNGYWSDLTRTSAVGTPKPALQRILEVVRKAQASAVSAVRPGMAAGEIDAIARESIAQEGFSAYFNHGTGHHVGFRYHDPGFGITAGQSAILKPGMIITVEPGVYVREHGGGARIEDNVLVTETGHEVLSSERGAPAS